MKVDFDLAVQKSLKNCHTKGLHSIVLNENNGCLQRMFFTSTEHDLWKNNCNFALNNYSHNKNQLSIGIHPHHVDIEIVPIYGNIVNILFALDVDNDKCFHRENYNKYIWDSALLNSNGGFKLVGQQDLFVVGREHLSVGDKKYMIANELHTVFVDKGQTAAWIINEYPATAEYIPYTWSDANLENWTANGLYQKMSKEEIEIVLNKFKIYEL